MLSSIGSTSANQVQAKRQEILQSAKDAGGAQARAVRFGERQAKASAQYRTTGSSGTGTQATTAKTATTAAAGTTGGTGTAATTGTSGTTGQTAAASGTTQTTANTALPKKVGWEVSLDDKTFSAIKKATGGTAVTGKGGGIDVTG
jgi:hypothetical protein